MKTETTGRWNAGGWSYYKDSTVPCLDCGHRNTSCHSHCEDYAKYKKAKAEKAEAKQQAIDSEYLSYRAKKSMR